MRSHDPSASGNKHDFMTLKELATYTRSSPDTVRYWRQVGRGGPVSHKVGRRVLYRRADVEAWLDSTRSDGAA